MKAMVIPEFGGPDVFELRDRPEPTPGPDEVRVRVRALGLNPIDLGLRGGAQFGPPIELPAPLGFDVAGTVDACGEDIEAVREGDDVVYSIPPGGPGASVEYHVTAAETVVPMPDALSHVEAAGLPIAGGTAWTAIVNHGDVGIGDTVLVHGGAGGVGSFAVQLARAAGARVVATCGDYDADLVRSLGAAQAVDYRRDDALDQIAAATDAIDVVVDAAGGNVPDSLGLLRPYGRAVTVVGVEGDLNAALHKNIAVHFVHLDDPPATLRQLCRAVEDGFVEPVIGATVPFEDIAEGHRLLAAGGAEVHGKVIVEGP